MKRIAEEELTKRIEDCPFEAMGEGIIVERVTDVNVTDGGILLPDGAIEKPHEGVILSAGIEVDDEICVGDIVLISKYVGTTIEFGSTSYAVIKPGDVLARRKNFDVD